MNAAANVVEVRVPDLGGFRDVAVIDVMVKPGDSIDVDTPLVTLESDKAAMDVPSTVSGVIEKVHTTKGGKVNTGDLLATLKSAASTATAGGAAPGATAPASAPAAAAQPSPPPPARAQSPAPAAAPAAPPASPAPPATAAAAAPERPGKLVPFSQLGA